MDDELYQTFITESEESITQLNNSLLQLESDPDDEEAIADIFRRAHTLKGNFGAMGFDDAATVAHAIEDLLDEVRHDRLDVTAERMDLVFEGVDRILDVLHEIERTGESTVDTESTVGALRAAADGETGGPDANEPEVTAADAGGHGDAATDGDATTDGDTAAGEDDDSAAGEDDDSAADEDDDSAADEADGGGATGGTDVDPSVLLGRAGELAADLTAVDSLFHVELTFGGGGMKSVDGGLFVGSIPEDVSVVAAAPALDDIDEGEYDEAIELWVSGPGDALADRMEALWSVSKATVTDLSDALDAAAGEPAAISGRSATPGSDASGAAGAGRGTPKAGRRPKPDDGNARTIQAVKSVRVDVDQLDELHELVEQLVTSRIKLRQAMDDTQVSDMDTLDELDKIGSNLQNTVMDMRLIPLKKVFDKFPRLVRDLARSQEKRVDFTVKGQDIELDRTILDEISDPLMHVLRNAVDHGIESVEEREAAGKEPSGSIVLRAEREHDTVVITVEDDGGGIDVAAVERKAISKGIATREELDVLTDEEVFDYIFHPGFSTNEEITDVSGRGVGMDVVKTTVEALDGSVAVASVPGEGTTFSVRLPVSVAIIKVLFVEVGDRQFGVPIKYIDEISQLRDVRSINGTEVVVHEDRIFPLIRLRDALSVSETDDGDGMIVRIRPVDRQVALHCDRVTRQEEVVVTPLQGPLAGATGLSGTAVIGDGNVIPIVDVGTLDLPAGADGDRREHRSARRPGEVAD